MLLGKESAARPSSGSWKSEVVWRGDLNPLGGFQIISSLNSLATWCFFNMFFYYPEMWEKMKLILNHVFFLQMGGLKKQYSMKYVSSLQCMTSNNNALGDSHSTLRRWSPEPIPPSARRPPEAILTDFGWIFRGQISSRPHRDPQKM